MLDLHLRHQHLLVSCAEVARAHTGEIVVEMLSKTNQESEQQKEERSPSKSYTHMAACSQSMWIIENLQTMNDILLCKDSLAFL